MEKTFDHCVNPFYEKPQDLCRATRRHDVTENNHHNIQRDIDNNTIIRPQMNIKRELPCFIIII